MDVTTTNQTAKPVINSLAEGNVLQESVDLLTQRGSVQEILPVLSADVSVNKNKRQNEASPLSIVPTPVDIPNTSALATIGISNTSSVGLSLPPPKSNLNVTESSSDAALLSCLLPAPASFSSAGIRATSTPPPHSSSGQTGPAQLAPAPCASDFDSDTELSVVAAATTTVITTTIDHSTTSSASTVASTPVQTALLATANGHANSSNSNSCQQLSLITKQQRQQKRRRERAQRLQAERDNRCGLSALSGTLIGGSVGVGVGLGINAATGSSNTGMIGSVTAPTILIGSSSSLGPGNSMLYHLNSAGSMGEDSNNSNGNFTSSSNGSNNLLPPTDSIASLLLNPPHSPECNSGLMATPSDSEGESLDEDLLSTSSSSTLLLPRDKPPPRPPPPVRRKLPRSPVLEEEIIDGFAILEFKTYEDLEFAIKLGQKRKEKRLSALEELTCTYSIEEMKMPKIIDTGQPHPLRTTNSSNLSSASNNNLKESNHHQHRSVNVGSGSGGTIVATANTISTNNNSTNNNSNRIYNMPMSSIPDTEAVKWVGDPYGQQQEKLASKENQISSSQHLNHVIQSNNSVMNISNTPVAGTVNTVTVSCILEEHIEKLSTGAVVPHIELSDNRNENSSGGTSQDTINNDSQPKSDVAEYINMKDTKSTDASPMNNRLSTMLSSCSKAIKLKNVESSETDANAETVAEGLKLEIEDYAIETAKVLAASILLNKDTDPNGSFTDVSNHCTISKKETNICDKAIGGNKVSDNQQTVKFCRLNI
ncbi:PREDICTED: AAC-rich mRNA clone AAC11 protein-like isoform X1 [Drosophila arizonae]|uniref:AAC-rich mRNA clone AAC11 protein-like isoform X1 n=1 Tax=Drosophila arizonae TaxID=7263 RepID=A0ABM1PZX6_DROAR|nr:PREDICTED: AAC-rich mRNA clone AAC11 protein-like isoform X1 [Drosophila arizonae]